MAGRSCSYRSLLACITHQCHEFEYGWVFQWYEGGQTAARQSPSFSLLSRPSVVVHSHLVRTPPASDFHAPAALWNFLELLSSGPQLLLVFCVLLRSSESAGRLNDKPCAICKLIVISVSGDSGREGGNNSGALGLWMPCSARPPGWGCSYFWRVGASGVGFTFVGGTGTGVRLDLISPYGSYLDIRGTFIPSYTRAQNRLAADFRYGLDMPRVDWDPIADLD